MGTARLIPEWFNINKEKQNKKCHWMDESIMKEDRKQGSGNPFSNIGVDKSSTVVSTQNSLFLCFCLFIIVFVFNYKLLLPIAANTAFHLMKVIWDLVSLELQTRSKNESSFKDYIIQCVSNYLYNYSYTICST